MRAEVPQREDGPIIGHHLKGARMATRFVARWTALGALARPHKSQASRVARRQELDVRGVEPAAGRRRAAWRRCATAASVAVLLAALVPPAAQAASGSLVSWG